MPTGSSEVAHRYYSPTLTMRMSRIPQELSVYTSLGYTRLDNHSFKKNLFKTNFLIEKFQILIFL